MNQGVIFTLKRQKKWKFVNRSVKFTPLPEENRAESIHLMLKQIPFYSHIFSATKQINGRLNPDPQKNVKLFRRKFFQTQIPRTRKSAFYHSQK